MILLVNSYLDKGLRRSDRLECPSWTVYSESEVDPYVIVFPNFFTSTKSKLTICSPFFKAMFDHNFKEANGHIVLKDVNVVSLISILSHVLDDGLLKVEEDNVFDLYTTAIYLQMDEIMKKCDDFVLNHMLNVTTAVDIVHSLKRIVGIVESNSRTLRSALMLILVCFDDVLETFLFKNDLGMNIHVIEIVLEAFSDPRCMVRDEVDVVVHLAHALFNSAGEEGDIWEAFTKIVRCLRQPEVSLSLIRQRITDPINITSKNDDSDYLRQRSVFLSCLDSIISDNNPLLGCKSRKFNIKNLTIPTRPVVLAVLINPSTEERELHLMTLNEQSTPKLESLSKLKFEDISWSLCEASICSLNSKIYVIGGLKERPKRYGESVQWLKHVYSYDVITNEWSQEIEMKPVRRKCNATAFSHSAIVRGGFGRHRVRLQDAIHLDFQTKKSQEVANCSELSTLYLMSIAAWGSDGGLLITNSNCDNKVLLKLVKEEQHDLFVSVSKESGEKSDSSICCLWSFVGHLKSFADIRLKTMIELPFRDSLGEIRLIISPQSTVMLSSILTLYKVGQNKLYVVDLSSEEVIKKARVVTEFKHKLWSACRCGDKVYNFVTLYKDEDMDNQDPFVPSSWHVNPPEMRVPLNSLVECFDLRENSLSIEWSMNYSEDVMNESGPIKKLVFCDPKDPSDACFPIIDFKC